jgi:hypothetical protein
MRSPVKLPLILSIGTDIDLYEMSFNPMKPVRKVWLREPGRPVKRVEDAKHTVLLLYSKNSGEGLIADPTYAQYCFESGVETIKDYCEHKVEMKDRKFEMCQLGRATAVQAEFDDDFFGQATTAITSRTADNTILHHLDSIGGKDRFFNMDAAAYRRCQDDMMQIMFDKELEQKAEIAETVSSAEDEDKVKLYGEQLERQPHLFADQLFDLVEDCNRVGHQVCSESLKRYLGAGSDATDENS